MNPFELIPPDIQPLIISAATSLGTNYLVNGESGPIQTISDLWYLYGPGKLHEKVLDEQQNRALLRENKQQLKIAETIASKVAKIPEENLHEPRENIARPSISALKDYGSEEHTRKMFAELIAASMDSSKDSVAHQSFVEIVKNMAPIDAKLLKILSASINEPIAEIHLEQDNGDFQLFFSNLFIHDSLEEDSSLIATSITNLNRLGIIEITYQSTISNKSVYDKFKSSTIYKDVVREIENYKIVLTNPDFSSLPMDVQNHAKEVAEYKVTLQNGLVRLTPLGKKFVSICLSD